MEALDEIYKIYIHASFGYFCTAQISKFQLNIVNIFSRMNNEMDFPANFEGLVLGCIDADFCK